MSYSQQQVGGVLIGINPNGCVQGTDRVGELAAEGELATDQGNSPSAVTGFFFCAARASRSRPARSPARSRQSRPGGDDTRPWSPGEASRAWSRMRSRWRDSQTG